MYGIHRMAGVRAKIYVEDLLDTTPPQQVLAHWEGLAPAPFFAAKYPISTCELISTR